MNDATFITLTFFVVLAGVVAFDAWRHSSLPNANAMDFKEFYCAGEAVLHHADPYRVEPLRSCIHRVEPAYAPAWLVTPAPLAGYALAVFAGFAALPFGLARALWEAVLVASVLVAAVALGRLTRWPPLLTSIALAPTVGFLNLAYGELTPIVVALLCLAGLALERGRPAVAVCCAAGALIEPHLGLPALVATMIGVPRARRWGFSAAVVLAAISVATVGLSANVEYFRHVLPLQAAAEVVANDQYSLTRVLDALRVPAPLALAMGTLSYVVMATFGIVTAVRLARVRRLAYLTLIPPAAAAFGGAYIHDVQLAVAVPLALLLAADVPALRLCALGALAMLLLPATSHHLPTFPIAAFAAFVALAVFGVLAIRDRSRSERAMIIGVQAIACLAVVAWIWVAARRPLVESAVVPATAAPAIASADYAPVVWGAFLRENATSSRANVTLVVEKIPGWCALLLLCGCALWTVRGAPIPVKPARDVLGAGVS